MCDWGGGPNSMANYFEPIGKDCGERARKYKPFDLTKFETEVSEIVKAIIEEKKKEILIF